MNRYSKQAVAIVPLTLLVLTLAACVAPQRHPDYSSSSASTTLAPSPMQRVATPAGVPMAPPSVRMPVVAPADYRQYLETNLMCPAKTVLDVQTARQKAFDAGLISGKPTELPAGAGTGYLYPVNGELTVFGFKVVKLLFEGGMDNTGKLMTNSGGLYADLEASFEAVEKVVRSRGVRLRKIKGAPGLSGTRPGDQFVALERQGKFVRFGCGIPID